RPEQESVATQQVWEACAAAQKKITALMAERAVRRANCGHSAPSHIRKVSELGVHDAVIRFKCGRSDCPFCWRRRKVKTIKRGLKALVFDATGKPAARKVFAGTINWSDWKALNRKLRRRHGKDCGRLHLRTTDGRALVVSEVPFEGGEEIPSTAG